MRNAESGRGATIRTLVRILKVLERTDWIEALAPQVSVSPLQVLTSRSRRPRQRASAARAPRTPRTPGTRPARRHAAAVKASLTVYRPVEAVEVRIWGTRVGAIALDPKLGYYAFEYDPRFRATGIELSPLKMPLSAEPYAFPELPERTYYRLPALAADAIPDRYGSALVTAYLQREGVRASDITPLDRLAYMGRRAFGALEFRPERGPRAYKPTALDMNELVETARQALAGTLDTGPHAEAALTHLIRVGTSAGGARAKAAIGWNPATREIRAGQFDLPPGFEHWLLKFDGMGDDLELGASAHYGRIEFAYARMAAEAGIDVAACDMLEENGRAHFMTRRFDRDGNRKHHMQTLCALAHLDFNQLATHDYAQWFMAARDLGLGDEAGARSSPAPRST